MIQVIRRAFDALEAISQSKDRSLRLSEIARSLGLGLTTAGNIVSSLRVLGYLSKNEHGEYILGEGLARLVIAQHIRPVFRRVGEGLVRDLALMLGESAVLAVLKNDARYVLAEATVKGGVQVDGELHRPGRIFDTATGRVLLAYASDHERARVLKARRFPTASEWAGVADLPALAKILERIRRDSAVVIQSPHHVALAVPLFDAKGFARGSLGVYVPSGRKSRRGQKAILAALHGQAARAKNEI